MEPPSLPSLEAHRRSVRNVIVSLGGPQCPVDEIGYTSCIQGLDSPMLTELFRRIWHYGTVRRFSEVYNINQGNFSRWLAGKKTSAASINAVKSFLINGPPSSGTAPVSTPAPRNINLIGALDRLINNFENQVVEAVALIDGDHAAGKVAHLANAINTFGIKMQIVVALTNRHNPASLQSYRHQPWLTVCESETNSKDAADTLLNGIAFILCSTVLRKRPAIHLLIVSGDGFAHELTAELQLLGFGNAYLLPVLSNLELDAWIYITLPSLIPEDILMRISDERSLITEVLESVAAPTTDSFVDLGTAALTNAFRDQGLTPSLPLRSIVVAYVASPTTIKNYVGDGNVTVLNSEQLRTEYNLRWRGTMRDFATRYNLNLGNFSSWLHKRILSHTPSEQAVRQWLAEGGLSQ